MFAYKRRVQFYETDAQGIVHHSNYFRYFEEVRGEFLRHLGYPYSALRSEGFEVVLLSASCDFLKPLYYDEEFSVVLSVEHFDRFKLSFSYVLHTQNILKAKGSTKHCMLRGGKLASIPESLREKLNQFSLGHGRR